MKQSLRGIIALLTFFLFPFISRAQTATEDVIYLKSGAIIYGVILENIPDQHVTIKTDEGSVLTNNWSQIYKVTKVPVNIHKRRDTTFYAKGERKSGFINETSLDGGIAFLIDPDNLTKRVSYSYGIETVFGYLFKNNFSIGLGIGYAKIDSFSFVPMFADIRYFSGPKSKQVVFAFDIGNSTEIKPVSTYDNGGFMSCFSIHENVTLSKKTSLVIGVEYTYQPLTYAVSQMYYGYTFYQRYNDNVSCIKINLGISFY